MIKFKSEKPFYFIGFISFITGIGLILFLFFFNLFINHRKNKEYLIKNIKWHVIGIYSKYLYILLPNEIKNKEIISINVLSTITLPNNFIYNDQNIIKSIMPGKLPLYNAFLFDYPSG